MALAQPKRLVLPIIVKSSIHKSGLIRSMNMKHPIQGLVGQIMVKERHSYPFIVFEGLNAGTIKTIWGRLANKGVKIFVAHVITGFDGVGVVTAESISLSTNDVEALKTGGYTAIDRVKGPKAAFDSNLIKRIIKLGAERIALSSGRNFFGVATETSPIMLAWAFENTIIASDNIAQVIIRTNSEFDRALSTVVQSLGLTLADGNSMIT